jgi:DNA-directed RNA polymerase specialized sigma24 family protein
MDSSDNPNPSPARPEVKPLTRASKETGQPYRRDSGVEDQIAEALVFDPDALRSRAQNSDKEDAHYLKEEALVYLIRENHLKGQQTLSEGLSEVLLGRCLPFIKAKVRHLGVDHAEEAEGAVVEALFSRILDPTSDRGDFLQVRFWAFLDRLLSDATRKQLRLLREAKMQDNPDWVSGREPRDDESGEHQSKPAAAGGVSAEYKMLIRDALAALQEPYRTLVVLRYYDSWPIESSDPQEPTISKYFNKTPRTIRNWMAAADDKLREWREGAA